MNHKGDLIHVPVEQAAQPAEGECLLDRWWMHHPEHGLLGYLQPGRSFSFNPMCNRDGEVCKRVLKHWFTDHEPRFMPIVYLAHFEREARQVFGERKKA